MQNLRQPCPWLHMMGIRSHPGVLCKTATTRLLISAASLRPTAKSVRMPCSVYNTRISNPLLPGLHMLAGQQLCQLCNCLSEQVQLQAEVVNPLKPDCCLYTSICFRRHSDISCYTEVPQHQKAHAQVLVPARSSAVQPQSVLPSAGKSHRGAATLHIHPYCG